MEPAPEQQETDPYVGKLKAAERLIQQGYLRRDSKGFVYLTKRGTKALRQFTGGPLVRDSFDLDSAYYGTVHANRADEVTWALDFLNAYRRLDCFGELSENDLAFFDAHHSLNRTRPKARSTVYWMRYFHEIDEPSLDRLYRGGWEAVVSWRLDVERAVGALPRSRQRVFALYADGLDRDEIAESMGPEGGEGWTPQSANDRIKEVSRFVRQTTSLNTDGGGPVLEDADGPVPTSAANRVKDAYGWAGKQRSRRAWRREAA